MSKVLDVEVPDIGDFDAVPVIEVLVKAGDMVQQEQSLVTLESDKATMEIPAPAAGKVVEVKVEVGATVSQGDVILSLEAAESETAGQEATPPQQKADPAPAAPPESQSSACALSPLSRIHLRHRAGLAAMLVHQ